MRKLLRRLVPSSCTSCRSRVSSYADACADCGGDIGGSSMSVRRDSALVWLLGGALVGCLTMLLLSSH
jgi:hypothetical protein